MLLSEEGTGRRSKATPDPNPQEDESDGFPAVIEDLQRLKDSRAKDYEAQMESFATEHMRIRAAVYGRNSKPELVIQRVTGETSIVRREPLGRLFKEAIAGFKRSGGAFGRRNRAHEEVDGTEVICEGVLVPSTDFVAGGAGVMCAWRGSSDGLLITFRSSKAADAVMEAKLVDDSIEGSS
jgi:hypothetical protein